MRKVFNEFKKQDIELTEAESKYAEEIQEMLSNRFNKAKELKEQNDAAIALREIAKKEAEEEEHKNKTLSNFMIRNNINIDAAYYELIKEYDERKTEDDVEIHIKSQDSIDIDAIAYLISDYLKKFLLD